MRRIFALLATLLGLVVVVLLVVATLFLLRSMNRQLKKVPESFDRQNPEPDRNRHELCSPAHHEQQREPERHHCRKGGTPQSLEGQSEPGQPDLAKKPRCGIVAHSTRRLTRFGRPWLL